MADNDSEAQAEWQAKLEKYPSLKKFEELGDDYVESGDGREEKLLAFIKSHSDFPSMQDNPSLILQAIDEFAAEQDFLINIGSDKGDKLNGLVAVWKPKILVECGGYVGYSAIMFADQMRKDSGAEAHLWSLEFEAKYAAIASELVALAGLKDMVTIVIGPADESLRKLKADKQLDHIDFLFLDHVEDLYEQEFKVAKDELGLLKSRALIVADNVLRPGAPDYRKYVRSLPSVKSESLKALIMPGEMEDEIEITYVL